MVKSMTGYGRAVETVNGREFTVELRSVNNRYLDCTVKLPRSVSFAEDSVKQAVKNSISRGKVDVFVSIRSESASDVKITLNTAMVEGYLAAMKQMAADYPVRDDISVGLISRMPEVFSVEKPEVDEEQLLQDLMSVAAKALANFDAMRTTEGKALENDLRSRGQTILEYVAQVEAGNGQTVIDYRTRLENKLKEVLTNTAIDESRILTEAAIFADKVAVDEETVRLRSHLEQMNTMLTTGGAIGRKLDFLLQEMNRETNTIGSKCTDLKLTRIVVNIKAELEKIREQTQNIEYGAAMKLLNIGFGSMVAAGRVLAIVAPDSAPIKRVVQEAKERGMLIDASYGRKTKAVILMDTDHVILSAVPTENLYARWMDRPEEQIQEDGQ